MQLQNLIFIFGSVISTSSVNVGTLYAGRFISGVGVAFASAADVAYLNEISLPGRRGRLSSIFEVMVVLGVLLGSVASLSFASQEGGWRWMFLLPTFVVVVQSVLLFQIPESPKWLAQNKRLEDAKAAMTSLFRIDGASSSSSLSRLQQEQAIDALVNPVSHGSLNHPSSASASAEAMMRVISQYRKPLTAIASLMALGQLTGSVVVRNYAPTIFKDAGFSQSSALTFNLVTNVVNMVVVSVAAQYVDLYGRKLLLTVGFAVTCVGMLILGIGFALDDSTDVAVFLIGSVLASAGFNMGFGPVGWILSSEMFPVTIRGRALSLSIIIRNSFEFITNFLFLLSNKTIGDYGTCLVFCAFCICSLVFVRVGLVETKGLEPEDILALFNGRGLAHGGDGDRSGSDDSTGSAEGERERGDREADDLALLR